MVKLLVESKADVNLQNSYGETALDFADNFIRNEKERNKISCDDKTPTLEKMVSERKVKGLLTFNRLQHLLLLSGFEV